MIKAVGHIGVAVKDIEKTLATLCGALEIPVPGIRELPELRLKVAMIDLGGTWFEFVQDDNEYGLLATFVEERGNALHHICLLSDDLETDISAVEARGLAMFDQEPRMGIRGKRVAFSNPASLDGLVVELSEP
ncbi:MAG: VOC family protein [Chloroflexota bacterium]